MNELTVEFIEKRIKETFASFNLSEYYEDCRARVDDWPHLDIDLGDHLTEHFEFSEANPACLVAKTLLREGCERMGYIFVEKNDIVYVINQPRFHQLGLRFAGFTFRPIG